MLKKPGMRAYGSEFNLPIYYLLYNPFQLPWTTDIPIHAGTNYPLQCTVGCRVIPQEEIHRALATRNKDQSPVYNQLLTGTFAHAPHKAGWTLESYVVDLLLKCREGK